MAIFQISFALISIATLILASRKSFDSSLLILSFLAWAPSNLVLGAGSRTVQYALQGLVALLITFRHRTYRFHAKKWTISSGLLLMIIGAVLASFANDVGWRGPIRLVLLLQLFYFFAGISKEHVKNSYGFLIALSTLATLTIFSSTRPRVRIGIDPITRDEVYSNVVGHPNYLAYLAAFNFLLLLRNANSLKRIVHIFYLTANSSAVFFSGSRSASLALLIGIVLFTIRNQRVIENRKHYKSRRLVILLGLTFSVTLFYNTLSERSQEVLNSGGIAGNNSLGWRIDQWTTSLNVYNTLSGFFGLGWNNSSSYLLSGIRPHNSFLQALLEIGAIGALGLFLFITVLTFQISRNRAFYITPWILISSVVDGGALVPLISWCLLYLISTVTNNGIDNSSEQELTK